MAEKRISLHKLARLVADLSPQKLARLPLDRMPRPIPEQWCAQFPAAKRDALIALSRRLADPQQQQKSESELQAQVSAAVRWVLRRETIAAWLDSVEKSLREAESLLQRWREGTGSLRESGAWSSPASLQSEIELTSGGEVRVHDIEHVCGTLLLSFNSRQVVIGKYARLLNSLHKALKRELPIADLAEAVSEAERQLARLSRFMSRFRLVRLHLVNEEMTDHKRQIEAMSRRRLELDSNLQTVRHELKLAESWSKRLTPGRRSPDPAHLKQTIQTLESELDALSVPISDEQIYNWLNHLVDAVLDPDCQNMAKTQVDRARALFVSLLKYRRRHSSLPDPTAGGAISRAAGENATRELQQLLSSIIGARAPDPVLAARTPDEYRRSLEQIKNQMIQELLAPTTPRFAIS